MDSDRNLLFGVLALQADLLSPESFARACTLWSAEKSKSLADLLVQEEWLTPTDRADVEKLLDRKLRKHHGDVKAGLAEVTTDQIRESMASVADSDVRRSIAGATCSAPARVLVSTTAYVPEVRERYTLSRLHATGGIGQVWLARDPSLGRDVVLKELRPERFGQPEVCARFLREAQITGQLEHPGIVPVYELGRGPADQAPFYTMRFIRGRTLAEAARAHHDRMERGQADPMEIRDLLNAFVGVCNAVAYAHSRGVLHRDLKPQNVVLGDYGEAIVLDWGLAKVAGESEAGVALPLEMLANDKNQATLQGQVLGTPAYMAPEQAEGRLDLLDTRTDVYGLGAVLYEILTGKPPFAGGETTGVLRRVVHDEPSPPHSENAATPRALEAVCLKALAKQPAGRYSSAKELAAEVQRWLAGEAVLAYREPLSARLGRRVRRHRTLVTGAAAALLVALLGFAVVLGLQARSNAELRAANQRERARFDLAMEAIKTFHSGVSEDLLLNQKEFGPLRDKLLREAREFYRRLEGMLAGQADLDSRLALGISYHEVADLTRRIGSADEACDVNQRAVTLFEELAREAPNDARPRRELARSLRSQKIILGIIGRKDEELSMARRTRDLYQALVEADPSDLRLRGEWADCERDFGVSLSLHDRLGEALESVERARAALESPINGNSPPEHFRRQLATVYGSLALILDESGKRQEALRAYQRSCDLGEELFRANPKDPETTHELARNLGNMAGFWIADGQETKALAACDRALEVIRVGEDANPSIILFPAASAWINFARAGQLISLGRNDEALTALERARTIRERLIKANPSNVRNQVQLVGVQGQMSEIHRKAGRTKEALAALEQAREVASRLSDAHPEDLEYRGYVVEVDSSLAELHGAMHEPSKAFACFERALSLQRKLVKENPSTPQVQSGLAETLRRRGNLAQKLGRAGEAAANYRESISLLEALAKPEPGNLYGLARSQSLLSGLAGRPDSGLRSADGEAEAVKAVATLRRAIAAGWNNSAQARADTDLAPLHPRPDFQKLLAELDRKKPATGQ
jgi:serine/threonine-protein kinase